MSNCMFQFYDGLIVVDDTGLISLDEAMALFESRKPEFAKALGIGRDCQMCIWTECVSEMDYRVKLKDWHSGSVRYESGHFWIKE